MLASAAVDISMMSLNNAPSKPPRQSLSPPPPLPARPPIGRNSTDKSPSTPEISDTEKSNQVIIDSKSLLPLKMPSMSSVRKQLKPHLNILIFPMCV